MIDQAMIIDPVQDEKKPFQVEAKTTEHSPLETKNRLTENEADELVRKQPMVARRMMTMIGSRGSLMLRAALSDRNRQTPAGLRPQQQAESTTPTQVQQEAGTITPPAHRERTSKNKVIFTDPVVSRKYEYEPTPVMQQLCCDNLADSDESDSHQLQPQLAHLKQMTPESRRGLLRRRARLLAARQTRQFSLVSATTPKRIEADDDDDDDDDLFVLASPDIPDLLELSKKSPIKRPHELTLTSSEDDEESRSSSMCDDKAGTKNPSQDDGCLFSSPKVAKIAPYYHDGLDEMDPLELSSDCRCMGKRDGPAPTIRSYLPFSSTTKSNQIQSCSNQADEQHQHPEQHSIFGYFGSLWSQTTSYLFPGSS